MVTWDALLIGSLIIPLSMIGFGRFFIKTAGLSEINMFFGYRTPMSTKNKETWAFAHLYCGKLWWRIGLVMLPFTIVVMVILFFFRSDEHIIGTLGTAAIGVQLLFLLYPIIPTEVALRKNFDKHGNRKY